MDSFEQAFDNATKVTDLALKANQDLLRQLRRLRKASQDGNITAVKREQDRLSEALDETDPSRQRRRRRLALSTTSKRYNT